MRARRSPLRALRPIAALSLGLLPSCGLTDWITGGGGGGGGGHPITSTTVLEHEPNDTETTPDLLVPGRPVRGDLSFPGDVDWYTVRLFKGHTIKIELYATRLDQAAWDAAGTVPRLTVTNPFTQDTLLEHSFGVGWTFGAEDFEIPEFRVPFTGYVSFELRPDVDLAPGGRYVFRVSYADAGVNQLENETPFDIGGNDSAATAQPIHAGAVVGFHRDSNEDFFSLSVSGPSVLRLEILSQRNGVWGGQTSYYDPLLRLFDVDGTTLLAQNDDAFFSDPAIQYQVPSAGVYSIDVSQGPASTVGADYKLLVSVDSAAAAAESEPNDDALTANPIAYGGSVAGTIGPSEQDWFRFSGTAGDMVRLQVFDANNSQSASGTVVVGLFTSGGVTPVPFHEGPLFQVLTTILQQSGTFAIQVLPAPTAVAPTTYRLKLQRFHASTYESEPNDSLAQAPAFPASGFASGAIGAAGDRDTYKFTATSEQLVVFDVFAGNVATGSDQFAEYSGYGSTLAPLLTIRDTNGVALASSTSTPTNAVFTESILDGLPTAAIAFVAPPTSHTFYVEVTSADGTGGPDEYYVLQRR